MITSSHRALPMVLILLSVIAMAPNPAALAKTAARSPGNIPCGEALSLQRLGQRLEDLRETLKRTPPNSAWLRAPHPSTVIAAVLDRPEEWSPEMAPTLLEIATLVFRDPRWHDLLKADLLKLAALHQLASPELVQLVIDSVEERPVLRLIGDGSPNSTQYLLHYLASVRELGFEFSASQWAQLQQAQSRARQAHSLRDNKRYPYLDAPWGTDSVSASKNRGAHTDMPFLLEDFQTALKLYAKIL